MANAINWKFIATIEAESIIRRFGKEGFEIVGPTIRAEIIRAAVLVMVTRNVKKGEENEFLAFTPSELVNIEKEIARQLVKMGRMSEDEI